MKLQPRILVIGGLAAGPSAASKAKRVNPDAEVILIERTPYISYGICEIPYYLTGEYQDDRDLVVYSPERLQQHKNVTVWTHTEVEHIDRNNNTVQVKDLMKGVRRKEEYDRLIITTGSSPRMLPFMKPDMNNVFTIKELGKAYELHDFLKKHKPRTAIIIGGGFIGLEMAESFRKLDIEVTVLHRHIYPFSHMDKQSGDILVLALHENGVHYVPNSNVKSFGANADGNVKTVVTENGTFDADLVIVAVGVYPNTSLAQDAGVETGTTGAIKTNERQQTNLDGIYAAGDCCEVKNLITRRPTYIPLATVASKMAWTAGENAAGGRAAFKGAIRNIAVRVFEYEMSRVGLTQKEAEDTGYKTISETIQAPSRIPGMPHNARLTVTYLADKETGRLIGATLIGKDGAAQRGNVLAAMIQQESTIADVAALDLMYAPPFSPLWDPLLVAANQTLKKL